MRCVARLAGQLLIFLSALGAHGALPDDSSAVAWIRGGDEVYAGLPYTFLGHSDWQITFEVKPQAGAALELLWGSKGDQRSAWVVVDGRSLPVKSGGDYTGFRWLRVPLPDGVRGDRYTILLKPGEGKVAFIAEVRLTVPGGDPKRPDLKLARYQVKSAQTPESAYRGYSGEAFPEMRKVWDTPAPSPADPAGDAHIESTFRLAEQHARQANEALYRSRRYIDGWLAHADPATGLIPRNLGESRDFWNGRDSAARYEIRDIRAGQSSIRAGKELAEGCPVSLAPGKETRWSVKPL